MQLNVLRELRQAIGAVSSYELLEPVLQADGVRLEDVRGTLILLRTDRGLLATVQATGEIDERCSRCLVDLRCRLDINFEEEYLATVDPNTGARLRPSAAEDEFLIGDDFVLDLSEGLRQYILVLEPVKPLCREACAGLCPNCGADRNTGPCGCSPEFDERWGALAALNSKDSEGS